MPNRPTLLPDNDDLEILHQRQYETKVYLADPEHIIVRGIIVDNKPPGLYVEADPDWLEMHRMGIEFKVRLSSLEIVDAIVGFETNPYEACPSIAASYRQLIGLNVARGFNRRIRELFGGPRGCTHTTALLQAMAPAVHQSMWSVAIKLERMGARPTTDEDEIEAGRSKALQANLNTCHIWAEDGTQVQLMRAGQHNHTPLSIQRRMEELGVESDWP